ncbi:unnamed protein product [Diabrotica balteata]|uniref:Uncharacterized protein n=1 Tax=Diabrotica balteata TaxID=107213 RepID=A0A9N9T6I3_DIABA|nr:unnamed protein product [Diabrotica balteata]
MKTVFLAIFMVMIVASLADIIHLSRGNCGENEVEDCEPCCPQAEVTCQNKVAQPCGQPCPLSCIIKCVCAKGYFRDTTSDQSDGAEHLSNTAVNSTSENSQLANIEDLSNTNSSIEHNVFPIVAVNEEDNANIGVVENEEDEEDGTAIYITSKKIQELRDLANMSMVKQANRILQHSNDRLLLQK